MDDDLAAMRSAIDSLDAGAVADAIQVIGFECTDCGACCRGEDDEPHTATVFPSEARRLADQDEAWRDVVRPMPYGLDDRGDGVTLEWAIQTSSCGDCRFLAETDGDSRCTRYGSRPSICRTYPFTLRDSPEAPPQGEAVDAVGPVVAHECEGLGRDIDRDHAEALADELLERAATSLDEAAAVRGHLRSADTDHDGTVVIDSEGPKRPDGTALTRREPQR